jgi:hypothetical protein
MKPQYFALCTATCLVVLSSGYTASATMPLASPSRPMSQMSAPVAPPQSAAIALAYAAGIVDFACQQTRQDETWGAIG